MTRATFATGTVPAGAIAIVVLDATTKQPQSYGPVSGLLDVTVYGRGRCSVLPDGTVPVRAGDKVILRWVDDSGQLSAESPPIVVTKGR